MPIFANPLGLWLLLGVPAILAIHFLQQRARVVRTSTWFLIEKLAPDSARGRTWERLRSSRTLWLQLLAVILGTWIISEPRWVRAESAQTVVLVLDASASMEAFRDRALAAAEREMNLADGLAARTTWVVMTTNPREPALYRGGDRKAAAAALTSWQPELGRHDMSPALRLARTLAGAGGRTLLITDTREKTPEYQRAAGVGRPLENVGFAGATLNREASAVTWRALVKNHSAAPQRRSWHLESAGAATPPQPLELAAGAMVEISAAFPENVAQITVVLSADDFTADDRLPLLIPRPKPLAVSIDGNDDAAEFFRKLAPLVDGVTLSGNDAPGALRIARVTADELAREARGGIFYPPADRRARVSLLNEPVTPERDPLVAGLNWQGWLGSGPYGFPAQPGDVTLLWQSQWPLVWLRPGPSGAPERTPPRKLLLGFDWGTSNAARLPATVLLARRFLEAERDAQRAPYSANFDCGAPVPLSGVPFDGAFTLTFEPAQSSTATSAIARALPAAERVELRAPGRAGFFTVRRNDEVLVRGAAQFSDSRLGDFRAAETFFNDIRDERQAALERHTTGDPFVPLWLALLLAAVLGSWWVRTSKTDVPTVATKPEVPASALP